ncbi:uncharacterized protein LOC110240969 [Exaiptasia diaphana]|uniref:PID domain-containing protein n=1 Tax=Exaiptasia diaphana TaxID=2652724 RepID=A0A913XCM8_EXADI|nr:uncharacterized protein LOC110240969 [Exaiptasia diaphana]
MMLGKHGSHNIQEERSFQVKYMGYIQNTESGVTGIDKAVKKIHDRNRNEEKTCPRITVEVSKEGMTFNHGGSSKKQFFAIKEISYCSLNRFDTNIFAFNHHISKSPLNVECHAVLCNSEEKARAIGQSLYSAYREGHFEELRKERRRKLNVSPANLELQSENTAAVPKAGESNVEKAEVKANSTGVLDTELENIVKDMLDTVEREKGNIEEQK